MRTHSENTKVIERLFREQVPEVASGAIEIHGIAREVGVLCVAVVRSAHGAALDAVDTCVGPRGSRLKPIAKYLGSERLTVVRWSESVEEFIRNLVAPVEFPKISFDDQTRVATVIPTHKTGLPNSSPAARTALPRLASQLTGWDIKISTPA